MPDLPDDLRQNRLELGFQELVLLFAHEVYESLLLLELLNLELVQVLRETVLQVFFDILPLHLDLELLELPELLLELASQLA